jgi:hypothetical protein
MNTRVFDVVQIFSEQAISAVPIVDEDGIVVNLYETVDVIVCAKLSARAPILITTLDPRAPRRVPISRPHHPSSSWAEVF